ncbi:LCP family protein [Candidatus Saccharibacteria bacterium]|nr:LCP family protein [Candidatus Saccharibacteria bacterium]
MLDPNGDGRRRQRLDGPVRGRRSVAATNPTTLTPNPVIISVAPETPIAGPSRQVRQRSTSKHRGLVFGLLMLPILVVAALAAMVFRPHTPNTKLSALNIAASVVKKSIGETTTLKGQTNGQTNFLIYGMTKDGMRTDSIMLASYYWQQKKLVTINIPRDLQINDGYETAKFGEVYAYAYMRNKKDPQYASLFVAGQVAKEYGINIDYWVKFNMQGEVDLVNTLGGVDIDVPDGFTDYEYPTWNYSGYIRPAPSFVAGVQHMNGDTALIYSRSRHSLDNGEGSDFARSKRQMLVLSAVLTKVKSLGIVGNIGDISHYLTILGENVDTNMSTDEMVAFAPIAKTLNPDTDIEKGNWSTENGFLCSSTSSIGAYITLYGTIGSCTTPAGGGSDSKYRELAIYYMNHLIDSASLTPQAFINSAGPNLPAPYTTAVQAQASSSNSVLGASTSVAK